MCDLFLTCAHVTTRSSMEPLFESPKLDDDLRALVRQTFPEFYQQGMYVSILVVEFTGLQNIDVTFGEREKKMQKWQIQLKFSSNFSFVERLGVCSKFYHFCVCCLDRVCTTNIIYHLPVSRPVPEPQSQPQSQLHPPAETPPTLGSEGVGTMDNPMVIASDEELQGEDDEVTSAFSGEPGSPV